MNLYLKRLLSLMLIVLSLQWQILAYATPELKNTTENVGIPAGVSRPASPGLHVDGAVSAKAKGSGKKWLIPPPPPVELSAPMHLPLTNYDELNRLLSEPSWGSAVSPSPQVDGLHQSFGGKSKGIKRDVAKGTEKDIAASLPTINAAGPESSLQSPSPGKDLAAGGIADPEPDPMVIPESYLLGPGDRLLFVDPDQGTPESPYSTMLTVGPDGNIVIYGVGIVKAAGRTVPQVNAITRELAKADNDSPRMTLTLAQQRPIAVYVLGDVASPGLWKSNSPSAAQSAAEEAKVSPATQPDVTQSIGGPFIPFTAMQAIQLAGGVRDTADIRHIVVRQRSLGKTQNLDLWKLLAEGDFEQDIVLQAGDVIYVPAGGAPYPAERIGQAANQFRYVRVWGEFRQPGIYLLSPRDDLFSVIARAGGFTPTARVGAVEISRLNRNGSITKRVVSVEGALRGADRLGREKVVSGDVIIARTSLTKKYGPRIAQQIAVGMGAILLLYVSRNIVDRAANNSTQTVRLF